MPTVKVTKSDKTQKGKPYVCFDGKNTWQDFYYLGRDVERPEVGLTIEANTSSKTFDDGKTIWFLNGWKEVKQEAPKGNGRIASQSGWNIEPGDLSRLASNLVATAIEKGLIENPEDIYPWIAAAYRAGNQLRTGKVEDFNDPLPPVTVTEAKPSEEFEEEIPF